MKRIVGLILVICLLMVASCQKYDPGGIMVMDTDTIEFNDEKLTEKITIRNKGNRVLHWKITEKPNWINCDTEVWKYKGGQLF